MLNHEFEFNQEFVNNEPNYRNYLRDLQTVTLERIGEIERQRQKQIELNSKDYYIPEQDVLELRKKEVMGAMLKKIARISHIKSKINERRRKSFVRGRASMSRKKTP